MSRENHKTLPPPFPSSPQRPPRFGLYLKVDGELSSYRNFCEAYAIKHFLLELFEGRDVDFSDKFTMVTVDEALPVIEASTRGYGDPHGLKPVWDYKMSTAEQAWTLPLPYSYNIIALRTGQNILTQDPKPEPKTPSSRSQDPKPKKQRVTRTSKKRPSRDGLLTLADIISNYKINDMTPADARKILRLSKTPKPDAGWAWPEDEVQSIVDLLSS